MSVSKILLAEDDEHLRFVVQDNLEMQGFGVKAAQNGEEALAIFKKETPDLCILDVMMPKMDGFTLAAEIRKINPHIPIIFLTAKGLKEDRLQGFRLGGDDYITKPFSIEELIFRVEVFLKRPVVGSSPGKEEVFKTRLLEFYPEQHKIKTGTETIILTYKEAELLEIFFRRRGEVIPREEILMQIWGSDDYYKGRSLDVFVSKIRKYLSADPDVEVQTVHGIGFKFIVH